MNHAQSARVGSLDRLVELLGNPSQEASVTLAQPSSARKRAWPTRRADGEWIQAEALLAAELSQVPRLQWLAKRALDLIVATLALLLPLPFLALIAIAIHLDSPGPVIYKQNRVGSQWSWRRIRERRSKGTDSLAGQVFCMWKFRTMHQNADQKLKELMDCNVYNEDLFVKFENDPRITRVGRFLRRFSLDEWPQFVNVLKGEMSVVGNRPLPSYEAEQLSEVWQKIRFSSPAGITGLWQVSGRSDLSTQARLDLDNYSALKYTLGWSPWDDLLIILKTPWVMIMGKGAK